MEKKNVIMDMGFEGLLQLGYKELHYELITWIVANYDIGYHRLCMQTKVVVPVTPKDVREVLGISDNGVDILIYNRHGTPNRTYDIQILEDNMRDLPIGEEFKKSFLIFACATILAPNSKQKVCSPLGVAWIDDQIKRRLAAEIHTYGNYGHVQVWLYSQKNQLYIKMHLHMRPQAHIPITPPSTGDSDEAVNMERNKEEASTDVHPCSDQVMGKRTDATRTHSGQQRAPLQHGSNLVIPTPRRRYKHTPKRLVKSAAICKSPFVSQCLRLFPKISHQERLVADYALAEDGESSEILCDMHGAYITRDELCSLNGGCWVNSVVVLASLTTKAKKHEIRDRCRMFLNAENVGHDFSSCELLFFLVCDNNHWHIHVLNIPASRVEILFSLPLRRGNGISTVSRRLSKAIDKAFHDHGMLRYDCGMFAIKYMQHWNGATLAHSIMEDKMHLYRLRLVVNLLTNKANNAREKIMKACSM
ncbi:hypothetical protein CK203_102642 [Vitis vinifera]|uniref:Ubiquitin-like protease family profile domain-containing protein n=1 Tax=Vitis vinifera TaxID=29760 RepID=A0A438CX57_VITVI|nr:hypothetical protein CK203_102642 [Vitis vinifera]